MSDHVAYNKTLLKPPENFIWLVINDDNHMTHVISRLYCQNLITFEALKGLKKKLFGLFSGCRVSRWVSLCECVMVRPLLKRFACPSSTCPIWHNIGLFIVTSWFSFVNNMKILATNLKKSKPIQCLHSRG